MTDTTFTSTDSSPGKKTRSTVKKSSEKKVTAKKTTGKSTEKATGTKKPAVQIKSPPGKTVSSAVTPEERWRMIAEAAYLRAEQRGFVGGDPTDDWLQAEHEVDTKLKLNE